MDNIQDMHLKQSALERAYSRSYAQQKVKECLQELYPDELEDYGRFIEQLVSEQWDYEPKTHRLLMTRERWIEKEISTEDIFAEVIAASIFCNGSTLQAMCGRLAHLADGTYKQQCDTIGEVIYMCSVSGKFTLDKRGEDGMRVVTSHIELPKYVMDLIHRSAYMPPMLMAPVIQDNNNAGWLTTRKSVFLNDAHHENKAPLEYLNILGSVCFSVDRNMLKFDEADSWVDLDPKELENKRVERELTIRTIKDMLNHGNKFHFPHRYCSRYRSYVSGYQLSPQGRDYKKALLNLATEYVADETISF